MLLLWLAALRARALQPGDAVAVCLTGLERTLLSRPVRESYERYVAAPVRDAQAKPHAFILLTDAAGVPGRLEAEDRHHAYQAAALEAADARAALAGKSYNAVSSRALRPGEDALRARREACLPADSDLQGRHTSAIAVRRTLEQSA